MKTKEITHGQIGHFCHGGCSGYARGGRVSSGGSENNNPLPYIPPGGPQPTGGSNGKGFSLGDLLAVLGGAGIGAGILTKKFGEGSKPADVAGDLERTMGALPDDGVRGMSTGGIVDAEDEKDPSVIPEDIKEFIKKAHKDQRESRPDENWRIKPAEKAESVAPYKKDEESEEPESEMLHMATGGVVPGYDDGGAVDPDAAGNDLLNQIAPQGATALAGAPALATPPGASAAAVQPVIEAPDTTPDMPPDAPAPATPTPKLSAPTDADFMNKANNMLGLNPQEQASFLKLLGDNTQKSQIGAGLAGIGDAIASGGTLGKVNPGNLSKSEDIIQGKEKEGLEGMQTIRGNQEKVTELQQKLESQDPNSPLSKYAQKAYGSVGKKLGLDLSHASASLIADVAGKGVEELNTEYQGQLKQMGLQLQKEQVEATRANQEAERRQAAATAQQGAAKDIATRTLGRKLTDTFLPFSATAKADKQINATAQGPNQSGPLKVDSQAQYDALPPGTHYVDSYGTEKVKK